MNSWDLIKTGRYEEAVLRFTEELRGAPSTGNYNNRGTAYLHLGQYEKALSDFQAAEVTSAAELKTVGSGALCGVALWMSGKPDEALATWAAGVEASLAGLVKYGDAAGGVTIGNLLFFGGVRQCQPDAIQLASRFLKKRLRAKQSGAWPGSASRYLLDLIPESGMFAAISTTPILREREMCQAQFYKGVRALTKGEFPIYLQAMGEARTFGSIAKLGAEYYLSLHEAASSVGN